MSPGMRVAVLQALLGHACLGKPFKLESRTLHGQGTHLEKQPACQLQQCCSTHWWTRDAYNAAAPSHRREGLTVSATQQLDPRSLQGGRMAQHHEQSGLAVKTRRGTERADWSMTNKARCRGQIPDESFGTWEPVSTGLQVNQVHVHALACGEIVNLEGMCTLLTLCFTWQGDVAQQASTTSALVASSAQQLDSTVMCYILSACASRRGHMLAAMPCQSLP